MDCPGEVPVCPDLAPPGAARPRRSAACVAQAPVAAADQTRTAVAPGGARGARAAREHWGAPVPEDATTAAAAPATRDGRAPEAPDARSLGVAQAARRAATRRRILGRAAPGIPVATPDDRPDRAPVVSSRGCAHRGHDHRAASRRADGPPEAARRDECAGRCAGNARSAWKSGAPDGRGNGADSGAASFRNSSSSRQ